MTPRNHGITEAWNHQSDWSTKINLNYIVLKQNKHYMKCPEFRYRILYISIKKFDDFSFSYYLLLFWALKFKVDHVTWPRPFQGHFVVRRLGLAMINLRTKFEVSTITCNEDMKGNVECKKQSRFEPPFGDLRGNVQGSSMARWKAHCRLPVTADWTFFTSLHGWGTIKRNLSKSAFSEGVGHFESKF